MKTDKELFDNIPENLLTKNKLKHRGFSIEKSDDGVVTIKDIKTPMFSIVNKTDMAVLRKKGFLKGSTYLLMKSDEEKIDNYNELIAESTEAIRKNSNPRKKQEHQNNIDYYKEEVQYYTSQVSKWGKILKQ
jgi:hypothetical protein